MEGLRHTVAALDPTLALVAVAVFAGGFVRGLTGFGSALVIIPILTLAFGPRQAVAMHAIMEIPVILSLLPSVTREAERRTVMPMLIALALTTPLGALLLSIADPDIMKVVISAVVLVMVALLAAQTGLRITFGHKGATAAGTIGGMIQGATGIGGPPVVLALLSRGDKPRTARANVVAVMSAMIVVSIIAFTAYGLVTTHVLIVGAIAGPLCMLATTLGSRVFNAYGEGLHRKLALFVLAGTAISTILAGFARM